MVYDLYNLFCDLFCDRFSDLLYDLFDDLFYDRCCERKGSVDFSDATWVINSSGQFNILAWRNIYAD